MVFSKISCVMFFLVLGLVSADDCPPFWTGYGNHCYRFFGPPKTWQSAEEHCQEFFTRNGQGHLASIHNSEENDFLIQMWSSSLVPNENRVGDCVWIGHNDHANEGSFTWSDGTGVDYTGWRTNEPNNYGGRGEDCGSFYRTTEHVGWNDYRCEVALPYLCKMPSFYIREE
ncbi:alpha-N-acetylgalactosamine-specific lectin-like [Patiria miniata]|uniref:C-type lectin domain-containing protein n=1 Tax=Patiria miniata TaxID=46514 RepID=A0A913ZST3_PATMI|nr:alpha-N-acetylgalactosamine-specific lectin-like [Patiria miniata]